MSATRNDDLAFSKIFVLSNERFIYPYTVPFLSQLLGKYV